MVKPNGTNKYTNQLCALLSTSSIWPLPNNRWRLLPMCISFRRKPGSMCSSSRMNPGSFGGFLGRVIRLALFVCACKLTGFGRLFGGCSSDGITVSITYKKIKNHIYRFHIPKPCMVLLNSYYSSMIVLY